ncbi:MAG: pantetheine-phosphate adenylyltransferase [Fimbriimonadaceae bacterium]
MRSLAIYPGSFDPPTLGHLDVIERAASLFPRLIVAVGSNSAKKPLLSVDQRLEALRKSSAHLDNVGVDVFDGLLVDFVREVGADAVVRGLRATTDFEYEFQMAMVNRRLAPELEMVFLLTKWEYSYLSSSIVKEVALLGGDFREMVPSAVAEILAAELARRRH